ncbi:MAG: polX [Sporomusa sp.]|nr:polX [Sporomusa sp.]
MNKNNRKIILGHAWPVAELVVEYIKLQPGVMQAAVAGAIRRGLEIVQEIDIVAAALKPDSLVVAMMEMQGVEHVVSQETDRITLSLINHLICTVYIVSPVEYIAALTYYTGSAGYIAKLAEKAALQGLTFDSSGLMNRQGKQVVMTNERRLYEVLNVSYCEPESREDETELKPAGEAASPLVALSDIQGVFHVHTTYSDGMGSLADMAAAARKRGWKYLGIADHSQTAAYAGGLKPETVMAQRREIDKLNEAYPEFTILAGIESDILPNGSLDYPDEILASFDFVVASVHSAFRQSETDMTRRIVRAVNNRYVTMLGHPTGRILLRRKGYAVNLTEVIQAATDSGTIIEINASPYRLDLDWRWCRIAKGQGVVFAINPDAHAVDELENIKYGLASARKAGLTATDIINTCTSPEVIAILKRKRH